MGGESKENVRLSGVPETLLWTLYHRAIETQHPQSLFEDPKALELVDAIDYPFEERFGGERQASLAQAQGLRTRRFDQQVEGFLQAYPDGVVAALGEGLDTQFWRVDNEQVTWISVDLPPVIALRKRLLHHGDRQHAIAGSVLDEGWMDEIDPRANLLFTAQGLLMYLRPPEVHRLLAVLARRFPGATLVFDAIPKWYSSRTIRGQVTTDHGYLAPPMPWGLDRDERIWLRTAIPGVADLHEHPIERGRGLLFGEIVPACNEIPALRHQLPFPAVMSMRFLRASRIASPTRLRQ